MDHILQLMTTMSGNGFILAGLVVFISVAQWKISILRRRTNFSKAARSLTSRFYERADKLLGDDNVPDSIKDVLYDVLIAVTEPKFGCIAYEVLQERQVNQRPGGPVHDALMEFRAKAPELADEFGDAVRDAFAAIICSYGYEDDRVTMNVVNATSHQAQLVKYAERVERKVETAIISEGALVYA